MMSAAAALADPPLQADADLQRRVEAFIYREARLQDEHEYEAWEALWTDDAIYWVPANADDIDPDREMSIIYDNRSRIGVRVRQLLSGKRYTQEPASRLRHMVTNVEILSVDGAEIAAGCNVLVYESNNRGETLWAARTDYSLRQTPEGLRMVRKKVALVNLDKPLFTLSFLI
ncbi:aromatic-ring-hydroxylating dioxygenase subunit beta [Marinibaculum pumilum]|uniref:Aromatic-ring-hydroxylating dioxygenase subunit beta n=1 Tax=Marinibaculum pumilum TaxID=1766165 RepID=A0ABV7L537_9PROT